MSGRRGSKRGAGAHALALILALQLGAAAAVTPPEPARPLTLAEAIAMALEKSEAINIERESVLSADEAMNGAKGFYDPIFEVSADWRSNTNPVNSSFSGAPEGELAPTTEAAESLATISQLLPTGGSITGVAGVLRGTTDGVFELLSPAYATQVGVEFRQPLLRDRAIDAARFTIRVAATDRTRAGASLARGITDNVALVEQAYWTLVAARRETLVREEAVNLANEQLSETKIRIEQGVAPRTEIAQPIAELERRRGELLAAGEGVSRAENRLKLLILDDTDAELWSGHFEPTESLEVEPVPVEVESSIERALVSRPELAEEQAIVDRRRVETEFARDAVRPALDAFVTYNRYGFAGEANPAGTDLTGQPPVIPDGMEGGWGRSFGMLGEDNFNDVKAGLVFRIPIGNRAARAGEAIARSSERQAESGLSRARKIVRIEVLNAAAALDTAAQRIEAARAAREAAETQLSAEKDRYDAGLSTNFLVLTRQNDLSGARLAEIAARTDYRRAFAEMGRARGSLLEERGIALEPGLSGTSGTGNPARDED